MKPFRPIYLFDYVDLFLVDEVSKNALYKSDSLYIPDINKIILKNESGIEEKIINATNIFIHPDTFADWAIFLANNIANRENKIRLFIFCLSDYCFSNKTIQMFLIMFPDAKFMIQNWIGDHPRIELLPIGVTSICDYLPVQIERTELFFITFVSLNSTERLKYRDFVYAYPEIQKYMCGFLEKKEFLEKMSQHYFTFCPQGNGFDSYRLWEALSCRTVPILLETSFTLTLQKQYPRLPLIILTEYTDLFTLIPKLSKEWYQSIMSNCDLSPVYTDYWISKFKSSLSTKYIAM
jgi:hypothetical protein